MKKILTMALLMTCALTFTACSDDDDDNNDNNKATTSSLTPGVYVSSEGNYYSSINGDLTSYNPETGECVNDLFTTVNGRALSGTSNDAIIYGSKLYITNTDENVVEVADATTAKSIQQITLGSARCITADGGYIYVTSYYNNYVAKIDTTTMEVVATATTGSYPEDVTIFGGKIYVANSGYGSGNTVTKIDLATFQNEAELTVPTNPVEILTVATDPYRVCSGANKAANPGLEALPAANQIHTDRTTTKIADATLGAIGNGYLYLIDNNYYSTTGITYSKYDLSATTTSDWTLSNLPYSPYAVAVDTTRGDIYITSHAMAEAGGYTYADYYGNGYTMRYDASGNQLDQFVTGVSAGTIIFY